MPAEKNKCYTIKDVSKLIKVPIGTLKNWEGSYKDYLNVQRTKTGSRIYQELDLKIIKKLKLLSDKNLTEETIKFILGNNDEDHSELVEKNSNANNDDMFAEMIHLQTETVQAVQQISNSVDQLKEDLMKETKQVNQEICMEVKKEIIKGNMITEGIVQTYSESVLDRYELTFAQVKKIKDEIEKEQEEKIFLQKKIEEREELFQEFVQNYRQAAAAIEEKKEKRKLSNILHFFRGARKMI